MGSRVGGTTTRLDVEDAVCRLANEDGVMPDIPAGHDAMDAVCRPEPDDVEHAPVFEGVQDGASSKQRAASLVWFAVRHPIAAGDIGRPQRHLDWHNALRPNLSTLATRFSEATKLGENGWSQGSHTNAYRHALWQGLITAELGAGIAAKAGDLHEENPGKDLTQRRWTNSDATDPSASTSKKITAGETLLSDADETIDLLNNARARDLYQGAPDKSPRGLAEHYLKVFREQGFYTAEIQRGPLGEIRQVDIELERLDDRAYRDAMTNISKLTNTAVTPAEYAKALKDEQVHKDMLRREASFRRI